MTRNPGRIVLLMLALASPAGLLRCSTPDPRQGLPDLPEELLSGMESEVRGQIQETYRTALESPASAGAVGRTGMLLHAYGYYESAAGFYDHALALSPSSFRWTYCLGLADRRAGRNEEAAAAFREALRLRPDDLPARLHLASTLIDLNRTEESLPLLRGIVEQQADNALAHFHLGRALAARGLEDEAMASLLRACRLAPDFGAAHYALAQACRKQGNEESARQHAMLFERHKDSRPPGDDPLDREIRELRTGVSVLLERARQLQEQQRLEAAIAEYRKVLEIRPDHGMAHASLMGLYRHLGRLSEGEAQYRTVVGINPDIPEVHYNYGLLLLDRGQPEAAVQAFERALELNPSYADARANLGVLLAGLGQPARAAAHLRRALEMDRNHRLARYNLARLLLDDGKTSEAIELLSGAVAQEDSETTEIEALLTTALALDGRWPEAEEHGRRALLLARTYGQEEQARAAEVDLGKILLRRGNCAEALELLSSATSVRSDNKEAPTLILLLAQCHSRTGDRGRALEQARQALALARRQDQQQLVSAIEQVLASMGENSP